MFSFLEWSKVKNVLIAAEIGTWFVLTLSFPQVENVSVLWTETLHFLKVQHLVLQKQQ